mgnify:CR=1 FL=1
MPNPNPRLENLRHFKPKWESPTTAIRIPEKFKDDCLALARGLESGIIPTEWQSRLNLMTCTSESKCSDEQSSATTVNNGESIACTGDKLPYSVSDFKTLKLKGKNVIRVEDLIAAGILTDP